MPDTGFNRWSPYPKLTFTLSRVGAKLLREADVELADGSIGFTRLHEVQVNRDGVFIRVVALELNGDPLLGMKFLRDYHLHVEIQESGDVVAEPL